MGTVSILLNNVAYTFITNYWLALATRIACGLTVANNVIARSMLTEITDENNRPGSFAMLNVFHVLGIICGPIIGGFLSRPAHSMPGSVFDNEFFQEHEYSLPFIVVAGITAIVLVLMACLLKEPERARKHEPLLVNQIDSASDETLTDEPLTTAMSLRLLRDNRVFIASMVSMAIMQLVLGLQLESVAIWARISKDNGGLGWTSENWVGLVYSCGGISVLLFSAICSTPIMKALGDRTTTILFNFICAPILALYPFASQMPTDNATLAFCICSQVLWTATGGMFMISSNLYLNNSVDKRVLGSANGFTAAISSLLRSFGPLSAGLIFGWTA
jgi:MFS family permease